ncbi:MAG: hypothetical protein ABI210_10005 [Abditibacteriaceae bacterium]
MNNWRRSLKVLLTGVLLGLACSAAIADAPPVPSIFFWNSGGGTDYVNSPAKWGNGNFSVTKNVPFDTLETLQVTTRNLSEGVRFDLKNPLDLTPYMDKGVLRLRVKFSSGKGTGRGGGGFAPAAPMMQPRTSGAAQVLPPLGGAPGRGGLGNGSQVLSSESTEIDHLQLTLVLEKGIMSTIIDIPKRSGSESDVDLRKLHADADGWILFLVPLNELNTTPGASGNLQRVILTSDNEDTYNVSQLGLVVASDRMAVTIHRQGVPIGTQQGEITVKPGRLTLVADVEAGDGDPLLTWNFDADNSNSAPVTAQPAQGTAPTNDTSAPAPDASRVDGRGLVATYNYPNQEQNYRVEVTVHDRTNKNPDVKTSLLVKVRNGN